MKSDRKEEGGKRGGERRRESKRWREERQIGRERGCPKRKEGEGKGKALDGEEKERKRRERKGMEATGGKKESQLGGLEEKEV